MSDAEWLCTDVGSRVVTAIKLSDIDTVLFTVGDPSSETTIRLTREEAERQKWFAGPPYAVVEHVIDECDLPACSFDAEGNGHHSDLGFGRWVRVGEGAARHVEWRSAPRKRQTKRSAERLELMRLFHEEHDEEKSQELMRRLNELNARENGQHY